jgi:hypothetical protein
MQGREGEQKAGGLRDRDDGAHDAFAPVQGSSFVSQITVKERKELDFLK